MCGRSLDKWCPSDYGNLQWFTNAGNTHCDQWSSRSLPKLNRAGFHNCCHTWCYFLYLDLTNRSHRKFHNEQHYTFIFIYLCNGKYLCKTCQYLYSGYRLLSEHCVLFCQTSKSWRYFRTGYWCLFGQYPGVHHCGSDQCHQLHLDRTNKCKHYFRTRNYKRNGKL